LQRYLTFIISSNQSKLKHFIFYNNSYNNFSLSCNFISTQMTLFFKSLHNNFCSPHWLIYKRKVHVTSDNHIFTSKLQYKHRITHNETGWHFISP